MPRNFLTRRKFVLASAGAAALGAAPKLDPLPGETLERLHRLQRLWSAEVDVHATPWTM